MAPLRYQLRNGDTIEIVTSNRQHPSKDWLDFVRTPRAKTKIRQWIKRQERDQSIQLGKEILEKALEQSHLNLPNILKNEQLSSILEHFSLQTIEDLLANIGYGRISARQVVGRLKPKLGDDKEGHAGLMGKVVSRIRRKKSDRGIKVKGLEDILVRFANCCHPLPGERVIGFITRGRGVTIHKHDCRHVLDGDPDRLVEVIWEPSSEDVYAARLRVTSDDRKGILANISAILSQMDANIIEAEVRTTMDKKGIALFTVEIRDHRHLQEIINAVRKIRDVLIVERL
jgi:GTP pyrophosphokinase